MTHPRAVLAARSGNTVSSPLGAWNLAVPAIDESDLVQTLLDLLAIPSPAGFTDNIVHFVCERLDRLGFAFELTRRGAIRAELPGLMRAPHRALCAHLDTLGVQVKRLKENGRCALVPIGHWSARWSEGARVTLFSDQASFRGTILPLKASGHTFNKEIDSQPVSWDNVELRIDEAVHDRDGLAALGINVGDIGAIDPQPEVTGNGFITSRHLDDKAGVATMLAAMRALKTADIMPALDTYFLFTISEEVGSGASAALHGDVAELVAIDNGTTAPGQNSAEYGVTIAMADTTGPFDWHLTRLLIDLCKHNGLRHQRDVFRFYRCDAASAIEAGNDIRTALITFGVDASHGYERINLESLTSLAKLIVLYAQSPPAVQRDHLGITGPRADFPRQPSPKADPA